jgi:hypothetical protein
MAPDQCGELTAGQVPEFGVTQMKVVPSGGPKI